MRNQVFISYHPDNKDFLEDLQRTLKPLEGKGIVTWDDTKLQAGTKQEEELQTALASAKVALLLVSDKFLADDSILERQVRPLLEAAEKEELTILWIKVTNFVSGVTEIEKYTPAHEIEKTLNELPPNERNKIYVKIGEQLKELLLNPQTQEIPPSLRSHYKSIIKYIKKGQIVPFLGPEINLCDRSDEQLQFPEDWDPDSSYPPTQDELAAYIDKEYEHPFLEQFQCPLSDAQRNSLPEKCPLRGGEVKKMALGQVSEYIELKKGPEPLYQAIQNISQSSYSPNKIHNFLAKLPKYMRDKGYSNSLKLIVTANFDSTLEKAFKEANQPFDLVYYFQKDNRVGFKHQQFIQQKLDDGTTKIVENGEAKFIEEPHRYGESGAFLQQEGPIILKLYGPPHKGNEENNSFVITEDHYIDYLAHGSIPIPPKLLNNLRQSHIWFLGYSLNYWNQRVILHRIWGKEKKQHPWWAIGLNPTTLEQNLWDNSGVVWLNQSLDYYIDSLDKLLDELVENIPAKHPSSSTRRT